MSLHADVAVPVRDRSRLERLARYVLRPAICLDRLEAQPDGRLSYKLKTQWRDGTTHILMERHELLERLAPLIPPPRSHQVRYHGILAPCASGRDRITPGARRSASAAAAGEDEIHRAASRAPGTRPCRRREVETQASTETKPPTPRPVFFARSRRLPWADLLKRVFGTDALRCPCGKPMRVLAAITQPAVARRILECMALPSRAPPCVPARAAASVVDHWAEEHAAADFDQTPPVALTCSPEQGRTPRRP